MPIINSVINWIMKKRIHQIELFMKYPEEVQSEWLKKLLSTAKYTEFGKQYGFENIDSYETFRERVPIHTYDHIKPYVDRLRQGEQNILWPTPIKWFAKSSGTTAAKSKYIPVSKQSLEECHFKGGKDMLSIYINNYPESKIFDGKSIAMGGSHQITDVKSEQYYDGDLSAIIIENLPFWAQMFKTPNRSVALMDEWESKIEKMAQITKDENITSVLGVPSWSLLLLQRVLSITGKSHIKEVWPNLEAYVHGGVKFNPYRQQFEEVIGGTINYQETYNASEGFFGIQDCTDKSEMLLMLDYGVFYEFVPVSDMGSPNAKAIPLWEVKTGVNYAMLISTNAGLWRYDIGDTIRFTDTKPYRIVITGRSKYFINLAGEELILEDAEYAIAKACEKSGARINEYMAGPSDIANGAPMRHEWYFEFEKPPQDIAHFAEHLDTALKVQNSDYEAKRYKNMLLQPPLVQSVKSGVFYTWLKKHNKLGGQNKVPRLLNQRQYINELIDINNA